MLSGLDNTLILSRDVNGIVHSRSICGEKIALHILNIGGSPRLFAGLIRATSRYIRDRIRDDGFIILDTV